MEVYVRWDCLTLFFILFYRDEIHKNNKNPKATIVRQLEEKQDKATNATFSGLSHQRSPNCTPDTLICMVPQ